MTARTPKGAFAATPEPPYVAVIFTSTRTPDDTEGYARMAEAMEQLAAEQPGYLGIEAAREDLGITVSYWADDAAARAWKHVAAHLGAQHRGRERWYVDYRVRIATITRDYSLSSSDLGDPPA
jgi:heme-degrading monooxygenase HmoA